MLEILRDDDGHIQAACEWWLVDTQGHWTPEGQYVFLHQLEITPGVNLHTVRGWLVEQIGLHQPQALGVFWHRDHDAFPRPHAFRRSQLQQLQKEVGV